MKVAFIDALALLAAVPAAAADHSGTYQSNEAKSFWSNGELPKGFKLKIEMTFSANKLVYHAVNTTNPAKPYINDFESTLDDAVGPLHDNPRFNEIRILQLGPDSFQVLEQKDGDVIVGQHWEFSKDGKSKAFLEWFDRVK
jgi:hypothetical protein